MRGKYPALIFFGVFFALISVHEARADVAVGQDATAFVATTLDGKKFDLSSLKGKVVLLNFWATWCPSCRDEMPELEAIWRRFRNQGLEVLAVSADNARSRGMVRQVMQYFSFPAAMREAIVQNELFTPSQVPMTYVIDKAGKVVDIRTPPLKPLTEFELGDKIKALLEAKLETKTETKLEDKVEANNGNKTDEKK
jgi:peroxiredoxin